MAGSFFRGVGAQRLVHEFCGPCFGFVRFYRDVDKFRNGFGGRCSGVFRSISVPPICQFIQPVQPDEGCPDLHIPGGGGGVTIATSAANGKTQIQITDTGTGISAQVMKNIFDPFFTTKHSVKGVGLGLSVTYGIIKKHKGEILVDSLPGRGTTFTVFLPVKQENSATFTE